MTNFEKALLNEKVDRIPIWFMRQAGRYLPEYQKAKGKLNFWEMVTKPDLAAEITMQPIRRFDLDAAIIFSDIMVILHGLGLNVSFAAGAPEVSPVVRNENDILTLKNNLKSGLMKDRLGFYQETIRLTLDQLKPAQTNKNLIGFAAAPYTIGSYLLEGKTSKNHGKIRALMQSNPIFFDLLMELLVEATIEYLKIQIEAGVQIVQLFESWGDSFHPGDFSHKLQKPIAEIARAIAPKAPVIYFNRGASILKNTLLPLYNEGVSMLSVDWRMDIDYFGDKPVQGNLDPAILLAPPEVASRETKKILERRGRKPGYVFNLGHGIYPDANLESVQAMVETVQNWSPGV